MSTFSVDKIFSNISDEFVAIRRDILCSAVVFPRTISIQNDTPLKTIAVVDVINWQEVSTSVREDTEFVPVSAKEDLFRIIDLLKEFEDELLLYKMDMIQIYRGGIDLLRISFPNNKSNRSAYVEINDYRRAIHKERERVQWVYITTVVVISAILSTGGSILATYLMQYSHGRN